jgi:hypothetical protein
MSDFKCPDCGGTEYGVGKHNYCAPIESKAVGDNSEPFMTVVFKTNVSSFDKNPLHFKTQFGDVAVIRRGNALEELQAAEEKYLPVIRELVEMSISIHKITKECRAMLREPLLKEK